MAAPDWLVVRLPSPLDMMHVEAVADLLVQLRAWARAWGGMAEVLDATQALEIARQFGDRYQIAHALRHAGMLPLERGRFDDSLKVFQLGQMAFMPLDVGVLDAVLSRGRLSALSDVDAIAAFARTTDAGATIATGRADGLDEAVVLVARDNGVATVTAVAVATPHISPNPRRGPEVPVSSEPAGTCVVH